MLAEGSVERAGTGGALRAAVAQGGENHGRWRIFGTVITYQSSGKPGPELTYLPNYYYDDDTVRARITT